MDVAAVLRIGLTLLVTIAAAWLAVWASRRPNRVKNAPGRVRMPKFVPIIGWVFVVVGILLGLVAFLDPPDEDALPMQIAAVAILGGGVLFLSMFRNFYVAAGPHEVEWRTIFGTEKSIRYADIERYGLTEQNGQPMLNVRSTTGVSLNLNPRMYALDDLLLAIQFFEQYGYWPVEQAEPPRR